MKKYLGLVFLFIIIAAAVFLFTNLQSKKPIGETGGTLQVTTSFYPLYFFATQIGGDRATIYSVTPAGSEPHDYEPTTQDIVRIERGDMLILNGGVESWGDKMKENLKGTKVKIVVAGQGLLTQNLNEEGKRHLDPHIWLDPEIAMREVDKITEGFIAIDPNGQQFYEDNEKKLEIKLNELDLTYRQGLQNCLSRDIITSHAAFGYLAARYGLNQVTVTGVSPDAEPSAQQLAGVAKFAKEHNVKYIFFESLVSPKLSETIANEVGAKTLVLDPIEGLSDDDIGAGKNYFTVMEDNLKNLQIALQCNK